jgi:NADP-dependent aldehyde dehydrogenase
MQKYAIPVGAFALLQGPGEPVGRHLIQAEPFQAAGFTGSFRAGALLGRLASQRQRPIPFFAEMGSLNPVLILPEAQQESGHGAALAAAISRNAGQFCTRPSLLLLQECASTHSFLGSLANCLRTAGREVMLAERIFQNYRQACTALGRQPGLEILCGAESQGEEESWLGQPTLLATDAMTFLANRSLREEVFGPFTLAVRCAERGTLQRVVESLEGQLTGTLLGSEVELQAAGELIRALANRVGRLIFNGVPTGVRVSPAMQHGGPWPASSDSRFGAVDGLNYRRWVRPICWQNAPPSLLPGWLKG